LFGKAKSVLVRIESNLVWEVVREGDGPWMGVCRPLNLNAIGDTWGEFLEAANEATGVLLSDLLQEGELAAFLTRLGWHHSGDLPAPGIAARFDVGFDVKKRARFDDLVPA
jgi:hypothetical protein